MGNNVIVDIHNDHTIKSFDAETGVIKRIRQVGGTIVSGPIISGNTVAVTVQEPQGKKIKLYRLPSLLIFRTTSI
mgnify:FL=1|jgi:hypothetical protein